MNTFIWIMGISSAILAGAFLLVFAIGLLSFLYLHFIEEPRIARIRSKSAAKSNGLTFEQSFERLKRNLQEIDNESRAERLGLKIHQ